MDSENINNHVLHNMTVKCQTCGQLLKERHNDTFTFFCSKCHAESIHETINQYMDYQTINDINAYQDAMQEIEKVNDEFAKLGQRLMEQILTAIKLTMKKYNIVYPLKEDFTDDFFESVLSLFYEDVSLKNIKIVLSDDTTLSPDIFPCISIYYSLRDQDVPLIRNFGFKLDDKYNKVMRIIGPIINEVMTDDQHIHYYFDDNNKFFIMNNLGYTKVVDINENKITPSDIMYVLNKIKQDSVDK